MQLFWLIFMILGVPFYTLQESGIDAVACLHVPRAWRLWVFSLLARSFLVGGFHSLFWKKHPE
jgi:hypothetical protein